jgi:hypothetical protein
MKKLLFILFFGACFFGAHAQYWNLTGNSGTTTSNFLGTTSAQPLIFKTNNSERMRLLASGNFGIGTSVPQAILHIYDPVRLPAMLLPDDTSRYTTCKIFQITSANSSGEGFSILRTNQENAAALHFKEHGYVPLYIEGPGGGLMITPDGNVGIGKNNPQTKLDVNGSFTASSANITGDLSAQNASIIGRVGIGTNNPLQKL